MYPSSLIRPDLRIDKGYLRGALNLERRFTTVIGVLVYYIYSERTYLSLFNFDRQICKKVMIFYLSFSFFFLNSDISVTVYAINIIFSLSLLKVLLEGRVSQIFDICPRYYFMSKIG